MANVARGAIGYLGAALTVLALSVGLSTEASAGFYAYAVEQTSDYTFTGATVGTRTPLSSTSAVQTGSPSGSEGHSGTLDALQSFVGPGPRPAENTFTPLGQVNPDFVRGDALITNAPAAFTTNNVAEGFLNGPGNSAGSGSWSVSAPITLTTSGTVTLGFKFTNKLTLVNAPSNSLTGTVASDYGYNFSVQDNSGLTVFTDSPSAANRSLSLIAPGSSSTPGSGSLTITTGTLAAGAYTATISGSEHVFLNVVSTTVVPEPSSLGLLAIGVGALAGVSIWKRPSLGRA